LLSSLILFADSVEDLVSLLSSVSSRNGELDNLVVSVDANAEEEVGEANASSEFVDEFLDETMESGFDCVFESIDVVRHRFPLFLRKGLIGDASLLLLSDAAWSPSTKGITPYMSISCWSAFGVNDRSRSRISPKRASISNDADICRIVKSRSVNCFNASSRL
jgi:hypothetical protein